MNRQYRSPTNPNTLSRMGVFDSYAQDEQERKARERYAEFCENVRRDLDPIEAANGGILSFAEWMEENPHA